MLLVNSLFFSVGCILIKVGSKNNCNGLSNYFFGGKCCIL